MSQPPAV